MLQVNEDKCVGCGICIASCDFEALHVWGKAEVRYEACTECFVCIDYCPVEALEKSK